ncbi:MAG: hypothetical protein BGO95_06650 [Micrococcales bacterium 73-13]|nr:MAG: hypothetical protein BGO95_06650 [Micrococcales bacterium 73-13]
MTRSGRRGIAAALGLAALLLAGCAPAAPGPPGAGSALPGSPGLGGSDAGDAQPEADAGNGDERSIYLDIKANGFPAGSTVTFQRKSANCVRGEIEGTYRIPINELRIMSAVGSGASTCATETSWATWTLTVSLGPNAWYSYPPTTFEAAQTSTPSLAVPWVMEAKCWDAVIYRSVDCTGSTVTPEHWSDPIHLTLTLTKT